MSDDDIRQRLFDLGLHGVLNQWGVLPDTDWLPWLIEVEERERARRSLQRRVRNAKLGAFKPVADFEWAWPRTIDRKHLDELFTLRFVEEASNVVVVGPNGVGKTMLAKNLIHQGLLHGHSVRFVTASEMLNALAAQDSASALERRLRRLCRPRILCIDEVGYLSYGNRHADLLFEVVTRRYDLGKPLVITTNKAFRDWAEVFPNATCVVTLVDRLVHRSEIVSIDGDSFRLKEAQERKEAKQKARRAR